MSNSNWCVSSCDDEAVELVRRIVDRQHHALADRLGERADAFLRRAGVDVLLLELAVRLEQDQLHLERQVVLQVGADLLVGALGVAGDPLEVLLRSPGSSRSRSGRSCRCATRTCRSGCCSCRSTAPSASAPRRRSARPARARTAASDQRRRRERAAARAMRISRYLEEVQVGNWLRSYCDASRACKRCARHIRAADGGVCPLATRGRRPLQATAAYTGRLRMSE